MDHKSMTPEEREMHQSMVVTEASGVVNDARSTEAQREAAYARVDALGVEYLSLNIRSQYEGSAIRAESFDPTAQADLARMENADQRVAALRRLAKTPR